MNYLSQTMIAYARERGISPSKINNLENYHKQFLEEFNIDHAIKLHTPMDPLNHRPQLPFNNKPIYIGKFYQKKK